MTQNPSQFRSRYKNQVVFDPQTHNKSIPIPKLKSSQVRSPTLKSSQYRPARRNQVSLDAHTKTKRLSARKNRVNFDHHHHPHKNQKSIDRNTQNKVISARTRSISILRTKKKSLSITTLKPSQIRSLTQNQVNFDANTGIKLTRSPL